VGTATLGPGTLERIDAFWARRLGCAVVRVRTPGVQVIVHRPGPAPPGVHMLAHSGTLVLAGAPHALDRLTPRLEGTTSLPDAALLLEAYGDTLERVIGPTLLGYRKGAPEAPAGPPDVRLLESEDQAALRRLGDAVGDEDWQHAGLRTDGGAPMFGVFADDRLLAAASFEVLLDSVASLGVATHPAERGRGLARRVVAAAAGAAAEAGMLLQYQTLESNLASLRLATRLGFGVYGRSLAFRVADGAGSSSWVPPARSGRPLA
jgi:GNAT superfamily N-acetyltransferase